MDDHRDKASSAGGAGEAAAAPPPPPRIAQLATVRCVVEAVLPPSSCRELVFILRSLGVAGYRPGLRSLTLHDLAATAPALLPAVVSAREAVWHEVERSLGLECELFVEFTGLMGWQQGSSLGWHHDSNRPYLRQRHVSAVLYLNEGGGDDDGALASSPCHGGQGAARKHGREVTATDGAPTLPPTDAHPAATAARAPDFGGGAFCFQHHAPPHQAPEPQARGLQALTAGAGAPGSDAVLRVRPRPGLLVAYTSDDRNVHMVEPVLWGERCTLTLWFSLDPQAQEDAKVLQRLPRLPLRPRDLWPPGLPSTFYVPHSAQGSSSIGHEAVPQQEQQRQEGEDGTQSSQQQREQEHDRQGEGERRHDTCPQRQRGGANGGVACGPAEALDLRLLSLGQLGLACRQMDSHVEQGSSATGFGDAIGLLYVVADGEDALPVGEPMQQVQAGVGGACGIEGEGTLAKRRRVDGMPGGDVPGTAGLQEPGCGLDGDRPISLGVVVTDAGSIGTEAGGAGSVVWLPEVWLDLRAAAMFVHHSLWHGADGDLCALRRGLLDWCQREGMRSAWHAYMARQAARLGGVLGAWHAAGALTLADE